MTIQKLEPSSKKAGRWLVWLEDGSLLRLSEADVADLGLYRGMELTGEQWEQLREAEALGKLKARALNLVSVRSLSRRELVKKLSARPRLHAGEEPEETELDPEQEREALTARAEAVADWLENLGLLNDERYAGDVVRWCAEKGYGARRVRDELFRRGVPRELWDGALEGFSGAESAVDRFLAQKLRNWDGDPKELKRAADALARRGFGWEEIKEGLERFEAATDKGEL